MFAATVTVAQSAANDERITAAFVLALGREPEASEREHWRTQGELSVAGLLDAIREHLGTEPSAARLAAWRACRDALGREATEAELDAESGADALYVERVQRHRERLAQDAGEYAGVIQRAYRFVVGREAYAEELTYWRERGVFPYVLLVGCLDDWARRNQPGLMVTSGTPTVSINCVYLTTVRLSPVIATEARVAAGLAKPHEGAVEENPAAFGRNVIAAGADRIVAGGQIHFLVAGRADRG